MRGMIESKLIWLGLATMASYTGGRIGLGVVGIQILILLYIALPLQRVTAIGIILLFVFTAVLGGVDALFGSTNLHQAVCWFTVGTCYLILYEYIALYEISSALRDYGIPAVVVAILNFGIRFIPIAIEGTREVLIGSKARGELRFGKIRTFGAFATAVIVRLIHKFEDMWISYNIRQTRAKRFHIRLEFSDYLFMLFSLILISLILLNKWIYTMLLNA